MKNPLLDPPVEDRRLGRDWDHTEQIAQALEELEGAGALANELIQNADDAGSPSIVFRFTEHALEIEDEKGFEKCSTWDQDDCTDSANGRRRCDIHAFNKLGGASKRDDPESTGAFGVGFLSAFQVTDQPQVLSADVHLVVDDKAGCRVCRGGCGVPHRKRGTLILLPWAATQTATRRELRADAVNGAARRKLHREFRDAIPTAMLFLRNVREVTLEGFGDKDVFSKSKRGRSLTINGPQGDEKWTMLEAAFDGEASELRGQHRQIGKRKASLRIAFRPGERINGRLFATLPTQSETGLPIHVDSSFFPRRDRKGILLDSGYQAEWNEAAIGAAARLIGDEVEALARGLGPKPFWSLVKGAHELGGQNSPDSRALTPIWGSLKAALPDAPVMWTAANDWEVVAATAWPPPRKDQARMLAALEVPTVSDEIKRLVPRQALKITSVTLARLVDAVENAGAMDADDGFAPPIRSRSARGVLEKLLATLVSAEKVTPDEDLSEDKQGLRDRIKDLYVWETATGEPTSFNECWLGDRLTTSAFRGLPAYPLVEWGPRRSPSLRAIADVYGVKDAIGDLETDTDDCPETQLRQILRWLNKRVSDLNESELETLMDRRLFATVADGPALPARKMILLGGGFKDKLGLAQVIRRKDLQGIERIAKALGIRQLNFASYLKDHVALAVKDGSLDDRQCRELVGMCASNATAFDRDPELSELVSGLAFLPCKNGERSAPTEAYFDLKPVREILGSDAPVIALKPSKTGKSLLAELGVQRDPRPADITSRILEAPAKPTSASRAMVRAVLAFLAGRPRQVAESEDYAELRVDLEWLPAQGHSERWFSPRELYLRDDQALFATTWTFLGIARDLERKSRSALLALGVSASPSASLVVRYVTDLAETGQKPSAKVLRWLNARAEQPEIQELRGVAFLPDEQGGLFPPQEIFRNKHALRPWLPVLTLGGARPLKLLEALEVRSEPAAEDSVRVLGQIAVGVGEGNRPDRETELVLREAWRVLASDASCPIESLTGLPAFLDGTRRLRTAESVLINDQPGIEKHLGPEIQDLLITPDRLRMDAWERAGVAKISERLQAKVVNERLAATDTEVEARLEERFAAIARVLRAGGDPLDLLFSTLAGLRVRALSPLTVRFSIRGFPQAANTPPAVVSSHMSKRRTLFISRENGGVPWESIASRLRELLLPEGDQNVALALGTVLERADNVEVQRFLDQYGFPRLTAGDLEVLREEASRLRAMREETEEDAGDPGEDEEDDSGEERDEEEDLAPDDEEDDPREEGEESKEAEAGPGRGQAAGVSDGEVEEGGSEPDQEPNSGETRGSSGRGGGKERGSSESGRGGGRRFETFIYTDGSDADPDPTTARGSRTRMGEDGVDLAIEAIKRRVEQSGHSVHKMAHGQKGYDVVVKGVGGREIEWVEVKATEGQWSDAGVSLSLPQFELALTKGPSYWLYVVEYLYSRKAIIWPIRDPARRVNHVMYDSGWRELAEPEVKLEGAARRAE